MNLRSIAVLFGCILFAGRAHAQSNIPQIWANDGGDKITRDSLRATANPTAVHNRIWDGTTVHLFGGRNEVVAACLILEAPTTAATNVTVSFNQLTGPGGSVISSSPATGNGVFDWTQRPIELFYVRYLQILGLSLLSYEHYDERHIPKRMRRPFTGEGYGSGVWTDRPDHDKYYPDIAVPLELVPSFTIPAGSSQCIWADVYIPKSAAPGIYQGTVTIAEGGVTTHQVPVELMVRSFTLPDSPSAKTMVYYSGDNVNRRYMGSDYVNPTDPTNGPLSIKIRDRHFQMAHRHRLSLVDDNYDIVADQPSPYEWLGRLDGSLFTAAKGYDGPGVGVGNNVFAIGMYGSWSWQGGTEAQMWQHTNNWENWFETHSPATDTFLYLIDESSNYAQTEQWAKWMKENPGSGSRLRSFATIDLPHAVSNVPSLEIVASSLGVGITNTWETESAAYDSDPVKRFYLYNGSRPASGSFCTDDDGIALRELAWGQFKKHINRWFYWESTYYNNFQGNTGQTNVFQQARTFGGAAHFDSVLGQTGNNDTNGDGVLFYPGTDTVFPADSYGVQGPFASLRMKQWRRGIEDFDYLTMASQINPSAVQAIVNSMIPKVLWEYGVADPNDPTWVRTDISWPTDPDTWEAARAQLADIIEGQVSAGLSSVTIAPTMVAGRLDATGTVTLSAAAPPGGFLVNLTSSKPTTAKPANTTVTVPQGATSADFTIKTFAVTKNTLVTITASAGGITKTAAVTVVPLLKSVTLKPSSVTGGAAAVGTVTLNGAAPNDGSGGISVTLSDDSANAATPASVLVPTGATTAAFNIPTSPVAANATAHISAVYAGVTKTATLTVKSPSLSSLTLSPTSLTGGATSTATVKLTGAAPTGGVVVNLASSDAAATVPGSISVPAGALSAAFTVSTSHVAVVTKPVISATLGTVTKNATLTVKP